MAVQILSNPMFTYSPQGVDPTGMQLFTYEAGTSTKKKTWVDTSKSAEHSNPITLNAYGQPDNGSPIVIDGSYKFVIAPASDTDPPASGTVLADNYSSDLTPSVSGNFNLVSNGSFEDDTNGDGTPDSWVIAELTSGSIATDNTSQVHGLNSLSFTSGGSGGGAATSEDYIEVLAGSKYNGVLSIISSAVDTHNLMEVYWYTSAKVYISKSSVYDDAATNPTSWTQYNTTVTAPATAVYAKIVLTGVASDSTTIATSTKTRFDDIKLISVESPEIIGTTATATELNILDGITATTAELNILDGVTATASEINTLDASAQAVTGFTYSNIVYVDDVGDSQGSNGFDIAANIGTGETIGPTGSGATNIWTALDVLPANTKWIEISVISTVTSVLAVPASTRVEAWINGGTPSGANGYLVSYVFQQADGSTTERSGNINTVKVPVDSSNIFKMTYNVSGTGATGTSEMYLKAFGV